MRCTTHSYIFAIICKYLTKLNLYAKQRKKNISKNENKISSLISNVLLLNSKQMIF